MNLTHGELNVKQYYRMKFPLLPLCVQCTLFVVVYRDNIAVE